MSPERPPAVLSEAEIRAELLSDHSATRGQFLGHFANDVDELASAIHRAHARIGALPGNVERDLRAAWTEAFLDSALNSLLISSGLLVSGLLQPSGNMMRSYSENFATSLLVSHFRTKALEQLERDPKALPVHKSIDRLRRRRIQRLFDIDPAAWARFAEIAGFYDQYSHGSVFAIASRANFDRPGVRILGAGFDEAKLDAYRKELAIRTSAAARLLESVPYVEGYLRTSQKEGLILDEAPQ